VINRVIIGSVTDGEPTVDAGAAGIEVIDPKTLRVGSVYWRLWSSDGRTRYATRAGKLSLKQLEAGCEMTLVADSAEDLSRRLLDQPDVTQIEG
jgi:hypothetical protein